MAFLSKALGSPLLSEATKSSMELEFESGLRGQNRAVVGGEEMDYILPTTEYENVGEGPIDFRMEIITRFSELGILQPRQYHSGLNQIVLQSDRAR